MLLFKIKKWMPENQPFLSIITPVFNAEKSLQITIDSIKSQTFSNYEYIIVDGNSQDNTLNIIDANKDIVDKLISEEDKGLYDAMNKGILKASGKYVGIINSDDFYEEGAFDAIYKASKIYGEDCIFYSDMYIKYLKDKSIQKSDLNRRSLLNGRWKIPHPCMFVPRSTYIKYGGFDLKYDCYGADRELVLRLTSKDIKFFKTKTILSTFNFGGSTSKYHLLNLLTQIKQEYMLNYEYYNLTKTIRHTSYFIFRMFRNYLISKLLPERTFLKIRKVFNKRN